MSQKRKPHVKPSSGGGGPTKKRKEKNKTQPKTPMQRVVIIGPTGKRRLEWRNW